MSYEIQSTSWFKDNVLDGIVTSTISESCAIASMIIISFFSLKIGWEYFKFRMNSINDPSYDGKIIDFIEILRVSSLILMIGLYPALSESTTGAMRWINATTDKSSQTKQEMERIADKYYVQQRVMPAMEKMQNAKRVMDHFEDKGSPQQKAAAKKLYDDASLEYSGELMNMNGTTTGRQEEAPIVEVSFWDLLMGSPMDFIGTFINLLFGLIAMIMKWVISGYARVIFKLLLVIGPLAIAFSVFWKDKFLTWFEMLINIGLSFYLMNVLDIIIADYAKATFLNELGGTSENGIGQSIAFNLATIGAYLSIFKLTSAFAGSTGANSIMNKSMAFVGTLAAGAIMAFSGGAGAAAGGGGGAAAGAGGGGGGGNFAQAASQSIDRGSKETNVD